MSALPDQPPARIIPADEAEAWADGYAFLARAAEDAAEQREALAREVEAARAEGFAAGAAEGKARAAQALAQTEAEIAGYLAGIEGEVIALTNRILAEVLGGLDLSERVALAARHALAGLQEAHGMTLAVAPDLRAQVARRLGDDLAISVVADRHLSGDQAILSTPASSLDISISSQLDAILTALRGRA